MDITLDFGLPTGYEFRLLSGPNDDVAQLEPGLQPDVWGEGYKAVREFMNGSAVPELGIAEFPLLSKFDVAHWGGYGAARWIVVHQETGKIVAFGSLDTWITLRGREGKVENVYVHRGHRRLGIGTALMKRLVQSARGIGICGGTRVLSFEILETIGNIAFLNTLSRQLDAPIRMTVGTPDIDALLERLIAEFRLVEGPYSAE